MVRRCWVIFECRGVLLIWIIVEQGPIVLAVGAGECLEFFSLVLSLLSSFSLPLADGWLFFFLFFFFFFWGGGLYGPLRQYLVYIRPPPRGMKKEMIDRRKKGRIIPHPHPLQAQ